MDYKAFYAEVADWIMQVNHMSVTHGMESNNFWTWVSKSMGELSNKYGNNNLVVNQMSMLFLWLEQVYAERHKK